MKSALPLLAATVILPFPGVLTAAAPTPAIPEGAVYMAPQAPPAASMPVAPAPAAPGSKVEDVSFGTEDNVKLTGSFFLPRKKGRAHAVLLVHDAGSDRAQLEDLGTSLQRAGFAVLSVDLRGHGQSANADYDWAKLDEDGRSRAWVFTQRDLAGAADYLRTRDDVHSSSLTLVGYRSGGGAAIRYSSNDLNVRAVVALDPVQDELGFNLIKDLIALEELETLLVTPKEGRQTAERLAKAGHASTGGREWIHAATVKSDANDFLKDKRLGSEVSDWLRETIEPNKR